MEEIKRLKAELKLKEKEVKRREALKKNAEKFCDKMREIKAKDKVLFYYYRTTCQGHDGFRCKRSITDKKYYLEFFEYLKNSEDADWSQVQFEVDTIYDSERPSIEDLINICILFNIPFDEKVLTEAYNETIYKPDRFGCDICLDFKPVYHSDHDFTFRCFKKKNEADAWVDACICKVLVCNECCPKLLGKCPTCREKFNATCGLSESDVRKIKPLAEGEEDEDEKLIDV